MGEKERHILEVFMQLQIEELCGPYTSNLFEECQVM
jgi:hypothetical protein